MKAYFALFLLLILGCVEQVQERRMVEQVDIGDEFTVIYEDSEKYDRFKKHFLETNSFEWIAKKLNEKLRSNIHVVVRVKECGAPVSYYSYDYGEIVLCYELMNELEKSFKKEETELIEMVDDAMNFVLWHEIGHALIYELDIPITGRDEDAVDQLATIVLLNNQMEEELYATAIFFRSQSGFMQKVESELWAAHALSEQRFYNILCWVYGYDSVKYKGAITEGGLPKERAIRCGWEYDLMNRSWTRLMSPYMNP